MKATRVALVGATALLVIASAMPAFAAKPTRYELTVPDGWHGTTVTATVGSGSATAKAATSPDEFKYWRVKTECFQDGEIVMRHYSSFDGTTATIPLGPTPKWQEGSATCTSELGYFHKGVHTRWRVVDTTNFAAMWPDAEPVDESAGSTLSEDAGLEPSTTPDADQASFDGSMFIPL